MISSKDTVKEAILKAKAKKVYIEGNFVKLLADTSDPDVRAYIDECKRKDITARKKRLQITKQVQKQNKELEEAAVVKEALVLELQNSLEETKKLRDEALEDLEVMQKRTQFELISTIVKVALWVIVGVLTNAFSIVGTIMGVKYATDKD